MPMFAFQREIRFGDCDPSGIAYFPSYLNILNGVVEEFWTTIGFPWLELIRGRKLGTPTVHIACDFSRPSLFGDRLTFKLGVRQVGRSSLRLQHVVAGADGMRWKADQIVVATSIPDRRATAWPDDIRDALVRYVCQEDAGAARVPTDGEPDDHRADRDVQQAEGAT